MSRKRSKKKKKIEFKYVYKSSSQPSAGLVSVQKEDINLPTVSNTPKTVMSLLLPSLCLHTAR